MALSISTFQADVTPPLGSALCLGFVPPTVRIVDSLTARGLILFTGEKPIVLCAVDWVSIASESHDLWRDEIAAAAGTTRDRVSVHTIHPHDTPGTDRSAAKYLQEYKGLSEKMFDSAFEENTVSGVVEAARRSLDNKRSVTHLSMGKAKVEEFASNRRLLGEDGKVQYVRYSACNDEHFRGKNEGTIDPFVRSLVFWNQEHPLASLTYYASHPQSFYRRGAVSYDTVGLARGLREATVPEAAHIHFCGAGGNVTAGKYNDGSPVNRFKLATRLAAGMEQAWANSIKVPLTSSEVEWKIKQVALPINPYLVDNIEDIRSVLKDVNAETEKRIDAARQLSYIELKSAGRKIDITCLKLGPAFVLHMPGELFVEYQLAAQDMRPGQMICMAAYGDGGPAYIGTEVSYEQGGYECMPRSSRVAPEVEQVLVDAMRKLLR